MPRHDPEPRYYTSGKPLSPVHDFYANEFACALLMPIGEFVSLYNNPYLTYEDIAHHFRVETDEVAYWARRLIKTGGITPEMIRCRDIARH